MGYRIPTYANLEKSFNCGLFLGIGLYSAKAGNTIRVLIQLSLTGKLDARKKGSLFWATSTIARKDFVWIILTEAR